MAEDFEDKLKKKRRNYVKLIRIYVMPIIAVVVFLGIIIGLVIPKVSTILKELNTLADLDSQIVAERAEVTSLVALDAQKDNINTDLSILNELAPTGNTEVTRFQKKISDIISSVGLASTNERGNDSSIENINVQNKLVLREIPNQFELQGNLNQMFAFIEELGKLQDFIIVQKLELTKTNSEIWVMDITLVKYQFGNVTDDLFQSFLSVPLTQNVDPEVQEYIDSRKAQSVNNSQESTAEDSTVLESTEDSIDTLEDSLDDGNLEL